MASDTLPSIKNLPVGTLDSKPLKMAFILKIFLSTIMFSSSNSLDTELRDIPFSIVIIVESTSLELIDIKLVAIIINIVIINDCTVFSSFIKGLKISVIIFSNQWM